ncbi:MAG: DNA topoisomerase I [Candidatus Aenigmatarchaeota archaeon]|nr:MAG: DNA topoisomerase I [Candidatus Aenigmarchaeota archaeon]
MPYTLIVAEKPSAAKRIASALAEGGIEDIGTHGVKSYRIRRKGKDIVVAPAVGHLFGLNEKKSGASWRYPVFDVEWVPTFERNSASRWSKKYFDNMKTLSKRADEFISSCDYDIEGSVIAYNILRFICGTEEAKRMKFSTLTTHDLIQAYEKASNKLDFPQIRAGLARHTLDFFWGINLSRALTLSLRAAGGYKTLSTGRVQGPTLQLLEKREREIDAFKPTPFWQIQLTSEKGNEEITALHEKDKFWDKKEAESVHEKCKGKPAKVTSIDNRQQKQNPPFPFDLTTLQRESYRNFGYSPKMTLDIAQSLYEQAVISYPRTSSQQLSPKLGFKGIIDKLKNQKDYFDLCEKLLKKPRLVPNNGKKKDPAHPAIYPTGNRPKGLNAYQKKLYDLIVKRFLAVFCEPAIRESVKVSIGVNGETFIAEGIRTLEPKWMEFYMPYARFKENILPRLETGEVLPVKGIDMLDKETQPPKRYTQAAVLKEMESNGLGTKATRAMILETLYDRGYIEDKQITVTKLGKKVVSALEKYAPEVVSIELTRDFEEEMEAIQDGKKEWDDVVSEARSTLETTLKKFKEKEKDVGKELLEVVIEQHKKDNTVGKCKCGGNLIVRRSRKGKRFIGCDNYPKCTETFSLPQAGMIKMLKEKCDKCGLSIVSVKARGKRPWKLCVQCGFFTGKKSKKPATKKK